MAADPNLISIVGATGVVGQELIGILTERGVTPDRIRLFASSRSAGTSLNVGGTPVEVRETNTAQVGQAGVVYLAASSDLARRIGPELADSGCFVIDNSSAFRMDPATPLVVPEVNPDAVSAIKAAGRGLIANPNCSTIIMLVAVDPLRERWGVGRVLATTYQAVSGAGAAAMAELAAQTRDVLAGRPAVPEVLHEPCAFNVFSHDSDVDLITGRNVEEQKMIDETRKIWGDPEVLVDATCVRVPVMRAHTESIRVTLREPASVDEVRAELAAKPWLNVIDDRAGNRFPTPLRAGGSDETLVGRIREDVSMGEPDAKPRADGRTRHIHLMVCGDQIRKGAALNAIQIGDLLGAR
ncbi:MAG: aspartate-semialdehyde dehydrogenase [Phycisphaerales bacterium]|jgi:aspartate-semialdehyde dehydrogenase